MKGLPASQFKVKVNIFVIVLILQLRSATVVIAYLMMKQNMTCKQVTISSTMLCPKKTKSPNFVSQRNPLIFIG